MKKRIIIAIVIAILLSSLSLVNYLSKDKDSSKESEVVKSIRNKNYDTTETTITTTTTTTKKKTTKKTTKKITMKVNYNQQEILNYVHQEILNMGWSSSDYEATVNILIKESGINPNSVNKSSGACGLFQANPCKKAIKQYPDYMTNYKSQVKWGLNYIKGRYKTPSNAWKFWQEHKWY